MKNVGRWTRGGGIVILGLACTGAGPCGGGAGGGAPPPLATVVITHHGPTFESTVGIDGTYAWADHDVARGATAEDFLDPATNFLIYGTKPRELYIFDTAMRPGLPWHPEVRVHYASVGAFPLQPDGSIAASLNRAPIPPVSVRVVDRGKCFTMQPFGAGAVNGFFPTIDAQIAWTVEQNGHDSGWFTINSERWFSPQFIHVEGDPPGYNSDGFTLRLKFDFTKSCLGGSSDCTVGVEVRASYAVTTSGGVLHFESVGKPFVSIDANAATYADGGLDILTRSFLGPVFIAPGGLPPDEILARQFNTTLPELLNQATLEKVSSSTKVSLCNARDPAIGAAQCGSFGSGVGGALSARGAIAAALGAAIASSEGIPVTDGTLRATDIVNHFSADEFWCMPRPVPQDVNICADHDPSQLADDESGICQVHPDFRRVTVKPHQFDITWQNTDEPEPPILTALRYLAPDSAPSCDDLSSSRFPYGGRGTPRNTVDTTTRTYCTGNATRQHTCPQDKCLPCTDTYTTTCTDLGNQ